MPAPHPSVATVVPATFQTGILAGQNEWLHTVFKSHANTTPKFRFPDLVSACISLVVTAPSSELILRQYLVSHVAGRDLCAARRSIDVWPAQWAELLNLHRASWNRYPNPMFSLDHVSTACVGVVQAWPAAATKVLRQAHVNMLSRAAADGLIVN